MSGRAICDTMAAWLVAGFLWLAWVLARCLDLVYRALGWLGARWGR